MRAYIPEATRGLLVDSSGLPNIGKQPARWGRGSWGRRLSDPSLPCGKIPGMSGKPQGLITSQARILAVIYLSPEVSLSEIASRLDLDEKTVREKIEALVTRARDPNETAGPA